MCTCPKGIKILFGFLKCHLHTLQECSYYVKGGTSVLNVSLWPKRGSGVIGIDFFSYSSAGSR